MNVNYLFLQLVTYCNNRFYRGYYINDYKSGKGEIGFGKIEKDKKKKVDEDDEKSKKDAEEAARKRSIEENSEYEPLEYTPEENELASEFKHSFLGFFLANTSKLSLKDSFRQGTIHHYLLL